MIDEINVIKEKLAKAITNAELVLNLPELDNVAITSVAEALLEYEEFAPTVIEVERDIKKLELELKVCEIRQQRYYKEKGVKTVKEQEQLTREVMLDARKQLETYKEIRDNLRVKKTLYECIIRRGEGF